jgi:hypothetical protein
LTVGFPPGDPAVIVLFAADKAQMGDAFYNSVGVRADAAIDSYLYQTRDEANDE